MEKNVLYHSSKETKTSVYHNKESCTEGNNIEKKYWRAGDDGRPLCQNCIDINEKEKKISKSI